MMFNHTQGLAAEAELLAPDPCNDSLIETCPAEFVNKYGSDVLYFCMQSFDTKMSDTELKRDADAVKVIYGWMLSIVCIAGIVGNILSYIIMKSREFKGSTTATYLQVLMIMDSLYLLSNFLYYGVIIGARVGKWFIEPFLAYSKVYLSFTLIDIFRNSSILLTVVVTTERYVCVCHSLQANKLCTPRCSKLVSAAVILLTVIYEMPRFFILKVENHVLPNCTGPYYTIEPTDLVPRKAENALEYTGFVIFLAIPLVTLTILTGLLLTTVKKSAAFRKSMISSKPSHGKNGKEDRAHKKARHSEVNTTIILLSVVIMSIICSLPNTVIALIRLSQPLDHLFKTLPGSIVHYIAKLLLTINSAANVLLFCFFGQKFRRVFKRIFIKCYWGKRRQRQAYATVSYTAQSHIHEHPARDDSPIYHEEK